MAKGSRKNRKRDKARAIARPPEVVPSPQQSLLSKSRVSPLLTIGAGALVVLVAGTLFWFKISDNPVLRPYQTGEPTFVGSKTCGGCHETQAKLWQASQHRHAMDHATDQTVRGDFNDAAFEYAGTRSRFLRKNRKFFVETDGPDGKLGTFEVKYTFGIDPLQQYLIEFPDGRIQALRQHHGHRPVRS